MNLQLETITLDSWPFSLLGIAYGGGTRLQLEVLYSEYARAPSTTQLRSAWRARQAHRGVPLLVVVLHAGKAHVCGPSGEDPTVYPNLDPGQVERICQEALEQPSRQAALRALRDSLGSLEEDSLPGLRNEGFLATHELTHGVPNRHDWTQALSKAQGILSRTGKDLLSSLGFTIEQLDNVTDILKVGDHKNAVAVLLAENETPESGSERIPGNFSPVSYALARAEEQNLDWVVLIHGRKIRLYPVKIGVGVGRRGRTETFLECHTGLIPDDQAAYLWLLFSADALTPGGSIGSILTDSKDFAGDLANRLRERIYDEVIPRLAEGLAEARSIDNPTAQDLTITYQMAMRILFRLLFIAYGEDKDLLPYRFNGLYQRRSLKTKARELLELFNSNEAFGVEDTWWQEVRAIFHAVEKGNSSWGVPAYNGGLFASDLGTSPIGAALESVSLPDNVFGPALQYLLLVPTPDGVMGPVDFRTLGVREFGTIYEGLLESELSVAETDLIIDIRGKNKGIYRPCKEDEDPIVPKGKIYLHNASGARKSTGSYYTKQFAVEHLLDRALEPALDDHLARLDDLDEIEAAEAFFDFKVADIAMGSGHFLVAAVDRIEARFSSYLAKRAKEERPLPHVTQELAYLRKAAVEALGDASDSYPDFEENALLRRQIARRCIYGVDINEVAVQLARLGIWIHTFVPGLPLSLLDRNLVHGNSLVGVGQLSEFDDALKDSAMPLFQMDAQTFLVDASDALARLGKIADATTTELQQARKAWQEADIAIAPTKALCDILAAARIDGEDFPVLLTNWGKQRDSIVGSKKHKHALRVLSDMHPLHFPVAFPEVFLRERAGFDVILGNPPWDKLRFEAQQFWVPRAPGLNAVSADERSIMIRELRRERPHDAVLEKEEEDRRNRLQTMVTHAFKLQGRGRHGHHDSAKLFTERALALRAQDGFLGFVLPRTALVLGGWADLREAILRKSFTTIVQARNRNGWLFDEVHGQLTIVLLSCTRNTNHDREPVNLIWPAVSTKGDLEQASDSTALRITDAELTDLTDTWVVPWFSSRNDKEVFESMRSKPNLGAGESWIQAVADSSRWDFSGSGPHNRYTGPFDEGRSWQVLMARHVEAFRLVKTDDAPRHVSVPNTLAGLGLGVIVDEGKARLDVAHPAIVYRYPTMANNTRTLIAAILPESGYIYSKGYVHGLRTTEQSTCKLLALLAYMNTFISDWWCRRFIDRHVTKSSLFNLPLPCWSQDTQEEVASLSAALIARNEVTVLPGGHSINVASQLETKLDEDIHVKIESLAVSGFDLSSSDWYAMMNDFTERACSEEYRQKVVAAINRG